VRDVTAERLFRMIEAAEGADVDVLDEDSPAL
jgi:hypothetical protein